MVCGCDYNKKRIDICLLFLTHNKLIMKIFTKTLTSRQKMLRISQQQMKPAIPYQGKQKALHKQ